MLMAPESRPADESKHVDARARIRNSETSSRWFSIVFWVIGSSGLAFCYWFYAKVYVPAEQAKVHLSETQAYSRELRGVIAELGQWSTQASFDSVRAELVKFDSREDASVAVRSQLWDQFSKAYAPRAERLRRFDAMLEDVRGFPLDADKAAFLALQERVRLASGQFEEPLMQQIKDEWVPKREEIATRLGLFASGGMGSIEVRSIPSGAMLFLNDREVGTTPLQANGIRAGRLTLRLRHPKYHDFIYPIRVKEYGILNLTNLEMKPREGGAEITVLGVSPSDRVEIELICSSDDGETFDYVETFSGIYVSVSKLIVGAYDVTVYVNGKSRQSAKLEVIEGEISSWTARL